MGLDMYLTKEIYIAARYSHREVAGECKITIRGTPVNIDFNKIETITMSVGYWRKANAIHNWFVQNCQDGEDNCEKFAVSTKQLIQLRELCKKAIETEDASLLPPVGGFFFGNTEINEYYWQDLKDTIEILKDVQEKDYDDYFYQSSW